MRQIPLAIALTALLAFVRPTVAVAAAAAPSPAASVPVTIEAIEVNQAIQDLRLSVPLIANKATIFRVYLAATVSARTKINGVLALSEPDGSSRSLGSLAPYVTFGNDIPLPMRRLSKEGSLNFSLGPTLLKPGAYAVSVSAVEAFGTRLECANCSTFSQPFTVEPDAPFRIRLVGFRYPVKNSIAVPSSVDFDAIESWLRSAYPVGTLVSSRLIVDMPELSDTRDCTIVNGELAALRANDMGGGAIDPRTHYYGLVPDNNDLAYYMTGCANAIPEVPDPSSVASGPAGSHSSTINPWDIEHDSYAGWYAGHELAHTLGRSHPGFCHRQRSYDPLYPFAHGLLASESLEYAGWDSGNGHYELMKAVKSSIYHDMMTYCPFTWPSGYTYRALRRRILCEQDLQTGDTAQADPCKPSRQSTLADLGPEAATILRSGASAPALGEHGGRSAVGSTSGPPAGTDRAAQIVETHLEAVETEAIAVVAAVNMDAHSGRILHLMPVSRARVYASEPPTAQVTVRLLGDGDQLLSERGAPVMASSDERQDNDLVTIVLPLVEGIRTLELVVGGRVAETRHFGTEYPTIAGVQVQLTESGSQARAGKPAMSDRLRLSWTGAAASGPAGTTPVTYTVQRSGDANKTWETLAVGLTKTELIIESPFESRTTAYTYRIISSDGIHTIRSVTDPVVAPVP